ADERRDQCSRNGKSGQPGLQKQAGVRDHWRGERGVGGSRGREPGCAVRQPSQGVLKGGRQSRHENARAVGLPRSCPRLVDRARRIHLVRAFYGRAFAEIRRFPATATGAVRASHGTVGVQSASRQTWCQCTLWLRGGFSRCARGDRLTWSERGTRAGIGLSLGMISDLGDVYTTAIWIPFGGDAPGGRMRTNHSAKTRTHRVSRALSSTKNPMNSAEPRNHDRILWLGLLALLLAAACGTSANPGPGTPTRSGPTGSGASPTPPWRGPATWRSAWPTAARW